MGSGLIHAGAWDGCEYIRDMGEQESHAGRGNWDGVRPLLLIEPQTEAFRELHKNLGGKYNVRLERAALGAKPGVATLHTASPSHSSSLLPPDEALGLYPEISFEGEENVRMDTLDGVIERIGGEGFYTEMVIDVQGYELEVLRGATETLKDLSWIMCEVTTRELWEGCAKLGEIDDFLTEHGFALDQLDLYGPEESCGDAIYVRL